MNINELSIGSLVMDELTGEWMKTTYLCDEIDDNRMVFDVLDRSKYPLPNGWKAVGIPANDTDALIRIGFVMQPRKYVDTNQKPFYFLTYKGITYNTNHGFWINNYRMDMQPKFIHEVQQLVRLITGDILTVKS